MVHSEKHFNPPYLPLMTTHTHTHFSLEKKPFTKTEKNHFLFQNPAVDFFSNVFLLPSFLLFVFVMEIYDNWTTIDSILFFSSRKKEIAKVIWLYGVFIRRILEVTWIFLKWTPGILNKFYGQFKAFASEGIKLCKYSRIYSSSFLVKNVVRYKVWY